MAISQSEIDTILQSLIESEAASYAIGNRSVTKIDIEKLLKVQQKMASIADRNSRGRISLGKMRKAK